MPPGQGGPGNLLRGPEEWPSKWGTHSHPELIIGSGNLGPWVASFDFFFLRKLGKLCKMFKYGKLFLKNLKHCMGYKIHFYGQNLVQWPIACQLDLWCDF